MINISFTRVVPETLEDSKTDYSKIAKTYDTYRQVKEIWLSKIIEFSEVEADKVVLDFGCGTGRYALGISDLKNPTICGLDPSIEMLRQAVEKDDGRAVNWINADGQLLPFRGITFDSIFMTLVIHHLEDKEKAIREVFLTLKRDGVCVVMTNSHSRIKGSYLRVFPGLIEKDLARSPTIPAIRKMMKNAGFSKTHFYPVEHNEFSPRSEIIERVRNKYISTLTLYSDEEFERYFTVFRKRVEEDCGDEILRHTGFDFVKGFKDKAP